MKQVVDSLIEELEEKFGESSFVTLRQLVDCGVYGSMSAARIALAEGRLPFIRISPRRLAIPRQALFEFLRKNLLEKSCNPKIEY